MRRRAERPIAPLKVLFVCTANISRSPYAERRAALMAGAGTESGALRFSSAGVPGFPGRGMDPEMAKQLKVRGAEIHGHVSRSLIEDILADADLVVTVEFAHRLRISQRWPEQAPKVFSLRQLADAFGRVPLPTVGLDALDSALAVTAPDSLVWDLPDPYKRGAAAARACAETIDQALAVIVPRLAGIPAL